MSKYKGHLSIRKKVSSKGATSNDMNLRKRTRIHTVTSKEKNGAGERNSGCKHVLTNPKNRYGQHILFIGILEDSICLIIYVGEREKCICSSIVVFWGLYGVHYCSELVILIYKLSCLEELVRWLCEVNWGRFFKQGTKYLLYIRMVYSIWKT